MADLLARPSSTAPLECEQQREEGPLYAMTVNGNSSMKVVVRVRPENEAELRSSCHCVVRVLDEHVLVFDPAGTSTSSSAQGDARNTFTSFSSTPGEH